MNAARRRQELTSETTGVPDKFGHQKKCSVGNAPRAPTDLVRCPLDAGSPREVRKEYPEIQKISQEFLKHGFYARPFL